MEYSKAQIFQFTKGKVARKMRVAKTYTQKKQPCIGDLRKRCSENILQIYRRTPMPKRDFNKVAKNTHAKA